MDALWIPLLAASLAILVLLTTYWTFRDHAREQQEEREREAERARGQLPGASRYKSRR